MKRIHYTDNYLLSPTHPVTVNLIGCGGTGSQVYTSLARINQALIALGHPGLYVFSFDADMISESNIARQLFSPSDIGLNKAEVLTTRLNRFFGTDWHAYNYMYDESSNAANIIISCVDNIKSRLEIAKLNTEECHPLYNPIYWLDFGNGRSTGQFVLGSFNKVNQPSVKNTETVSKLKLVTELFDYSKVNEEDSGPSCSLAAALSKQDLFINSSLSMLGCNLLWRLFSVGSTDCQGGYLNLETMRVNPIRI